MKVSDAKTILDEAKLSEKTNKVLEIILGDEPERELTNAEIRQIVLIVEVEIEEDKAEVEKINEKIFGLKNYSSRIQNAAEMYLNDLKSLE